MPLQSRYVWLCGNDTDFVWSKMHKIPKSIACVWKKSGFRFVVVGNLCVRCSFEFQWYVIIIWCECLFLTAVLIGFLLPAAGHITASKSLHRNHNRLSLFGRPKGMWCSIFDESLVVTNLTENKIERKFNLIANAPGRTTSCRFYFNFSILISNAREHHCLFVREIDKMR